MAILPLKIKKHLEDFSDKEKELILRAYLFAKEKHKGQKRKSGQDYIIHPVSVASYLAEDGNDVTSIVSALLHDTLEDTKTDKHEIEHKFGKDVAEIVNGITKISSIKIKDKPDFFTNDDLFLAQVDNYRKLLLATTSDIRVILIKLYDRLHNVETIKYLHPSKHEFYAIETIEIYAPIAERLGMGKLKGKLEDLAFPYAYPEEYRQFQRSAKKAYKDPQIVIDSLIPIVKEKLNKSGITFDSVSGRSKHLYSLFLKMKDRDISTIFDIVALRVVVESEGDCYKTLGIIHSLYKPLPGRIFDYIARPKPSGYQSIHTTVKDTVGNVFEIQIRTKEMHCVAEHGACAHWHYKEGHTDKNKNEWLEELKKIEQIQNGEELIRTIKEELFSKKVFVFTPKGQIIDLPVGSTAIDLGYRIHTDIGNHCSGVKINGRLEPLKTALRTGDIVQIITSKNSSPSKDWLKMVITSGARTKINHFIREQNIEKYRNAGKVIFEETLQKYKLKALDPKEVEKALQKSRIAYNDFDSALAAVGERHLSKIRLIKVLYPGFTIKENKKEKTVSANKKSISSLKGIRHSYAGCCKPKEGDAIVGYVTRSHIIKIHKKDCKKISSGDPLRFIKL